MDLLQLQYFRAVASMGHMTRAAEALHVSQPALSRAIRALEDELGVALFDRTGRSISLNRYGTAFLNRVNSALDSLEAGRSELRAMQAEVHPVVVSCVVTGAVTDLADAYRQMDPDTPVLFRMDPYDRLPALLANGDVDFAISDLYHPDTPSDGWTPVSEEHLFALVSPSDDLAQNAGLSLAQLSRRALVLPESSAPIREVLDHFSRLCGISLRPAYEVNDVYAQLHLVEQGQAISLIPSSALYDILSKHSAAGYTAIDRLRAVPILDEGVSWQMAVSPLSGRTRGAAAQRFRQRCLHLFSLRRQDMEDRLSKFCGHSLP